MDTPILPGDRGWAPQSFQGPSQPYPSRTPEPQDRVVHPNPARTPGMGILFLWDPWDGIPVPQGSYTILGWKFHPFGVSCTTMGYPGTGIPAPLGCFWGPQDKSQPLPRAHPPFPAGPGGSGGRGDKAGDLRGVPESWGHPKSRGCLRVSGQDLGLDFGVWVLG